MVLVPISFWLQYIFVFFLCFFCLFETMLVKEEFVYNAQHISTQITKVFVFLFFHMVCDNVIGGFWKQPC